MYKQNCKELKTGYTITDLEDINNGEDGISHILPVSPEKRKRKKTKRKSSKKLKKKSKAKQKQIS